MVRFLHSITILSRPFVSMGAGIGTTTGYVHSGCLALSAVRGTFLESDTDKGNIFTLFLASLVWQVDASRLAHGTKSFSNRRLHNHSACPQDGICLNVENDNALSGLCDDGFWLYSWCKGNAVYIRYGR